MSRTAEFYFDVGSPASYLAWTQLPRICEETGGTLVYKPMLLGGVYQATGNASPASIPAKGAYTAIDYARHARRYGVPYRQNPYFPIITLTLMRAATGVQMRQPERLQDFLRAVFNALWVDALNLNEPQLVASTLTDAGFDIERVLALTNDPEVKTRCVRPPTKRSHEASSALPPPSSASTCSSARTASNGFVTRCKASRCKARRAGDLAPRG